MTDDAKLLAEIDKLTDELCNLCAGLRRDGSARPPKS